MKNKIITSFFAAFIGLAVISAILYFGWGISLEASYWKILIPIIMFGIPTFVYFKNKK